MKLLQIDSLKGIIFASNTEKIRMTNEEFVKIASQQDGGSRVDPTIDFGYQFANEGILIEGLPPKVLKLIILANHVLKFGKELIAIIESKVSYGIGLGPRPASSASKCGCVNNPTSGGLKGNCFEKHGFSIQ